MPLKWDNRSLLVCRGWVGGVLVPQLAYSDVSDVAAVILVDSSQWRFCRFAWTFYAVCFGLGGCAMWCFCWSCFVSWPDVHHLKLTYCSVNLIGITVKTVVCVVYDFSKQAETILYYTPFCPLYTFFFLTSPDDGPEFRMEKSCKINLDFHSSWYLSLRMPIFCNIIRDLSYEHYAYHVMTLIQWLPNWAIKANNTCLLVNWRNTGATYDSKQVGPLRNAESRKEMSWASCFYCVQLRDVPVYYTAKTTSFDKRSQ